MVEPRTYNIEFLYLTTIGRTSGNPREIEIWYVSHDNCHYLVSGGREESHWVKNIRHNSQVTFWVQGQTYKGAGRVVDHTTEPELTETIAGLMQAKYNWSDGLIIELCPE